MMWHFNNQLIKAFTLIELMVVMAIMSILLTLSGGLMQKSISQQQRQVELEKVNQLFKKLSYQAYYGGEDISLHFEKNIIFIKRKNIALDEFNDKLEGSIKFEQLIFVAEDYLITTRGIITPEIYKILTKEHIITLPVPVLFHKIS